MTAPAGLQTARSLCAWTALLAGLAPPNFALQTSAVVLLCVAVLLDWANLRRIPRVLMVLAATGAVAAAAQAPEALTLAVRNTAQLGTLVIAVLLLSATLGASRDVQVLSGSLLAGRPLARYLGLAFATGVLAVPLNFGAVAVMSALVSRLRLHDGDDALTRNAARAVLRGFALASICSPLSFSVVLTLTMLPGLRLLELIAAAAPFAVAFILAGILFRESELHEAARLSPPKQYEQLARQAQSAPLEQLAGRNRNKPTALRATLARVSSWAAWLRFGGVIVGICVAAYVLSHAGGMRYARAVAFSCVAAAVIGLAVRALQRAPLQIPTFTSIGNELAVLGGSAFVGALAGQAGAALFGPAFALPLWACPLVAFTVPWLLFAGGAAGLNPIVTGTLVGALLGPIWPSAAVLGLGVGIVCGWGLTVAGTPWSANSLLLSRLTGYDAHTAAWRWNLRLSLLALTSAGLLSASLTWLRIAT